MKSIHSDHIRYWTPDKIKIVTVILESQQAFWFYTHRLNGAMKLSLYAQRANQYLRDWHLLPVNPARQLHLNPKGRSTHVPPFAHWLGLKHSFATGEKGSSEDQYNYIDEIDQQITSKVTQHSGSAVSFTILFLLLSSPLDTVIRIALTWNINRQDFAMNFDTLLYLKGSFAECRAYSCMQRTHCTMPALSAKVLLCSRCTCTMRCHFEV